MMKRPRIADCRFLLVLAALLPGLGCEPLPPNSSASPASSRSTLSSAAWSPSEKDNAAHLFLSFEAENAANELINRHFLVKDPPKREVDKILSLKKTALREAKLVEDAVLDKIHPELKTHFRDEYQKSLEAHLRGVEKGDDKADEISFDLGNDWADWYEDNQADFRRIPK